MTLAILLLAATAGTTEPNWLRDDFLPDNRGDYVGWNATTSGTDDMLNVRRVEGPDGRPAIRLTMVSEKTGSLKMSGFNFCAERNLKLVCGETYRLSAKVRTRGIPRSVDALWAVGVSKSQRKFGVLIPTDTAGEWREIVWEGKLDAASYKGYVCSVRLEYCLPDGAYLDLADPRLTGPSATEADRQELLGLKPFPIRITPVDPLLGEISSEAAAMDFYCPAASEEVGGEPKCVRATLGERTVTAGFDGDFRAMASFGPLPEGKTTLRAELVGKVSGKVYATNEYRARIRATIRGATPLRRLNNFVSEIFACPLRDGEYAFTLAKDTWVYLAVPVANDKILLKVDDVEVSLVPYGGRRETMRWLPSGRHVVSVSGTAGGEIVARTVCPLIGSGLARYTFRKPNFAGFHYGEEFADRFGFFETFNMPEGQEWMFGTPEGRAMKRKLRMRGSEILTPFGMAAYEPRKLRLDLDGYLSFVTNQPAYARNEPLIFDENSFLPYLGKVGKINAAEVWWRVHADGRCVSVNLDDGATSYPSNPHLDIPEFAAYANSGDGRAVISTEAYYRSPETPEDFARLIAAIKRQAKRLRSFVPGAMAHYSYLMNGWMMIGGWTSWYAPENDMRATMAEIMRVLATDPEFADAGGLAFSSACCPDDLMRFVFDAVRYYGIEGRTDSFAARNALVLFPKHVENGDFLRGFDGWTVEAAEAGTLETGHLDRYGEKWQARQYPRIYRVPQAKRIGNDFAVFTQSAKGPNVLRQKIVGLVPGRVYQLTYALADRETVERGFASGKFRETEAVNIPFLSVMVSGAEEIHDLRHAVTEQGKYSKDKILAERVVFRATTAEAEAVFSDWRGADEPGGKVGVKTLLNYVGVHPYYYKGEGELEALKRFFRRAKEESLPGKPAATPREGARSVADLPVACTARKTVADEAPSLLPDGKDFRLVWHDEFNGDRLDDSKWGYRTNFWGQRFAAFAGPEDGCVEVKDGKVHLKVKKRANGQFVSPQLQTGELLWDHPWQENRTGFWPLPKRGKPKFVHRYGYYEARFRLQRRPGWWSAFWMQTEMQGTCLDPSRAGIEQDIMESFAPGDLESHNFHMNGYGADYRGFPIPRGASGRPDRGHLRLSTDEFHTVGLLWEPDGYTVFVDGHRHGEKTDPAKGEPVSHVPEFILISTECQWYRNNRMTGTAVPELEAAVGAGDDFVVDFVRVYDVVGQEGG